MGKPLKSDTQSELEQVRRELARVKMERDILGKALGYFAKDPTWGSASLPNSGWVFGRWVRPVVPPASELRVDHSR